MSYDSTQDTEKHIETVQGFLSDVIGDLAARQLIHDASKLQEPEKSTYDEFTPKLRGSTYGSDEYKGFLKDMGVALKHHYENNSHHPEHYPNGINGMSLLDVIEMLADWKAAGMRHADGDIQKSLEINKKRFGVSDQLAEILRNTVKELGW
jgi:hypothetical protein